VTVPRKPLILFDGDCSFCRRWIDRWRFYAAERVDFEPYQQAADQFPQIPREQFRQKIQLIEPDGSISSGAAAVFRMLAISGRYRWLIWLYDFLPGFAFVTERVYRLVARHRNGFDKLDKLFIGQTREPATTQYTCALFLRALGAVYFIAFVSLWVQIQGLIGSDGILPAADYLNAIRRAIPDASQRVWQFPTLCWLNTSDGFLQALCAAGTVMSVLLIVGVAPIVMLAGLWLVYLSLVVAGQTFLGFQWDSLLLEAGFAAMLFAPAQLFVGLRTKREPSHVGLWLLRWLAFRIMFLSGITKLLWDDPAWLDWTALNYHYWTQPLPPWTAWYVNQLPAWFGKFSVGVMYFAELIIPFLIFGPRMVRRAAFWGIVLFQLSIALTGNYGFFNLLTIVICIPIVDDTFWWKRLRRNPVSPVRQPLLAGCGLAPIAIAVIAITLVAFARECRMAFPFPQWMRSLDECAYPFRSANGYGLFRVMTTFRHEIIVEGSDDGLTWKSYEFKYKPGDVDRRPMFCEPHMPRLDWQMWFAALGNYQSNPWFVSFVRRLLEGSPSVTRLLKNNPFPEHPPKYVRARLFDYRFTSRPERAQTSAWWRADELRYYLPPISLRDYSKNGD